MNKLEFKFMIINKCIETLEKKIEIAKDAMDEAQQSANDYGQPKDRYDSFRVQVLRKRDMFAQQLQKSLDDISILGRIKTDVLHEQVIFGSVVISNLHKLFISVPMGKLIIDNEIYQVISDKTPIFEAMRGLRKGDTFVFNGNQINILEVF